MQPGRQKIHFIAIGGSVMHNLAIALKEAGHQVGGSDDEIREPARSALAAHQLLPEQTGWFPEKLNSVDQVILGMHAQADNPELLMAQKLGLPITSFPDYIYQQSKDKQRIVIAGSHGKTTITAIVIHVLRYFKRSFDYVIGAKVKGLTNSVKLSGAPVIIIEGDEYLSSALDPTPKFLRYQHHIGLISGVAWDHANVFPTEEEYVKQFDIFADQTPKGGILIFCEQDSLAMMIGKKERADVLGIPYKVHSHEVRNGKVFLKNGKEEFPILLFGSHNLLNINGAKELLKKIGISPEQFYEALPSFEGASGRLEKISGTISSAVYKDFAHAPSKVKATINAMKEINPKKDLVACLELHTYSSLNKDYLPNYKGSLKAAGQAIVYFEPEKVRAKKLEPLSEEYIRNAMGLPDLVVFTDPGKLEEHLLTQSWENKDLIMMSSGNFGGIDIKKLAEKILVKQ